MDLERVIYLAEVILIDGTDTPARSRSSLANVFRLAFVVFAVFAVYNKSPQGVWAAAGCWLIIHSLEGLHSNYQQCAGVLTDNEYDQLDKQRGNDQIILAFGSVMLNTAIVTFFV